jgi:hypothetical protein
MRGFFKPVGGGALPFSQNQFGAAFGGTDISQRLSSQPPGAKPAPSGFVQPALAVS